MSSVSPCLLPTAAAEWHPWQPPPAAQPGCRQKWTRPSQRTAPTNSGNRITQITQEMAKEVFLMAQSLRRKECILVLNLQRAIGEWAGSIRGWTLRWHRRSMGCEGAAGRRPVGGAMLSVALTTPSSTPRKELRPRQPCALGGRSPPGPPLAHPEPCCTGLLR